MQKPLEKNSYSCEDLVQIVEMLRSPEGCPWDRAQDHHTIRNNFLEETYEAVEAIDRSDPVLLQEELGDVLLQIVLHVQMEAETGRFDFNDVCGGICRKMIDRHPHVFGSESASDLGEALETWEQKRREKGLYTLEDRLRQVSAALPALIRAQKLCSRAEKGGCTADRPDDELRQALEQALTAGEEQSSASWGKLLFLISARMNREGLSAEEALSHESDRMIESFLGRNHSEA